MFWIRMPAMRRAIVTTPVHKQLYMRHLVSKTCSLKPFASSLFTAVFPAHCASLEPSAKVFHFVNRIKSPYALSGSIAWGASLPKPLELIGCHSAAIPSQSPLKNKRGSITGLRQRLRFAQELESSPNARMPPRNNKISRHKCLVSL